MSTPLSRIGFHFHPDDRHNTRAEVEGWLPILRSFGASWLVVRTSSKRAAPEDFIAALREEGLEPILALPSRVGEVSPGEVAPLLSAYARWGLRHVVIHDRVNLRSSWEPSEWSRVGIVERFLDRMIPLWSLQADLRMVPMIPALEPGGDYWDTAFLEGVLRGLARRGQESLLDRMGIGAYAFTFGRPIDWGAGGPAAWPESRPYHTPEGSQDQRGLRLPEWYAAISQAAVGKAMPVYVLGGGAVPARAAADPEAAFAQNSGVARWLNGDEAPPGLQAFAFYLLTADETSPEAHAAWYASPDRPRYQVDPVRRAVAAAGKRGRPKALPHYILLPENAADPGLWTLAGRVAHRTPGAVGFSIEDARHAARVTLLADPAAFGEHAIADLERLGTRVERLDPGSLAVDPGEGAR